MNEKRNQTRGTAQPDLFEQTHGQGVGARHSTHPDPHRGGGYLETCGSRNFEPLNRDPRLDELVRIGLPRMWLRVAETIGFDMFLEVWRRLTDDAEETGYLRDTGGVKMPGLRSYDAYLRYQRNRYIETLAARGLRPAEVRRAVSRNLREPLNEKHVFKIMAKKDT